MLQMTRRHVLPALAAFLVACLMGCPPKTGTDTASTPKDPGTQQSGAAPTEASTPQAATKVDPSTIEVAIVTNAVAPFWDPMTVGMETAAKELGCKASWQGPAHAQVSEQKRLLENYVSKGVKGIAVSPLDAAAIKPVIDEMVDGGTHVLCIDSDVPESKRHCYIGTNNYEAGKVLGEKAKELLPEGATCVCFVGTMTAQNAQERVKGFEETVATKGIKVLDVMQDKTDKATARKNVEDTIQKHSDISALVGIWSYNLPAIAEAVKEQNLHSKIKVIGFDAEPATILGLENGDIDATVVQKPYEFGYRAVKILFALAVDDQKALAELVPENKLIDTGVDVWTPDNVADEKAKLEALGVKSS